MKIVMLGHTGAGKTTYVSLMYREMQDGVAGFQVRARDSRQHDTLLKHARQILRGRYPDPTHQRSVYDLSLFHDGTEVLPFSWRDYRGGALADRSTGTGVGELHADLTTADGIVLFVDAVTLTRDRHATREVRRLTTHVQRALDSRDEVLTPVVVAVTKCDLVDMDAPGVTDAILDPFGPLVTAIGATSHIHGTVLPIACGPEPANVVVPVLWSLRFGIAGQALQLMAEIEAAQSAAAAAAARDTVGDRVRSFLFSEPTYASISEGHAATARSRFAQLEPLLEPVQQLGALLEDFHSF